MPKRSSAAAPSSPSSSSSFSLAKPPSKRYKAAKSAFQLWKAEARATPAFAGLDAKTWTATAKSEFAQLCGEALLKWTTAAGEEKARVAAAEKELQAEQAAWRASAQASLAPLLEEALASGNNGGSLRELVASCRNPAMGQLPAQLEEQVCKAEAALRDADNAAADQAEAARVRAMSEAEVMAYVAEVRELRRQSGLAAAQQAAQQAARAKEAARAPVTAEALRKTIRQNLKAQFKFDKGLARGNQRTMKAQQPNVTQEVWDHLFPSAAGKQAFVISSPASTFDVAHSYFCRQMRYGSDMVVRSMDANLSKQGVLTVKGKYGMGFGGF